MKAAVPITNEDRERRRSAIASILETESIRSQGELVARLEAGGFAVTQSSVSRDLRDLEAVKTGGCYRLPSRDAPTDAAPDLASAIREWTAAGPHLVVVHTRTGAAPQAGLAIDRAAWPEVAGTIAGDDTLFIAVAGLRQRQRVEERLRALERR